MQETQTKTMTQNAQKQYGRQNEDLLKIQNMRKAGWKWKKNTSTMSRVRKCWELPGDAKKLNLLQKKRVKTRQNFGSNYMKS